MVYGFNNVRGNFQLIPWTVGTLRIQRPDQNGMKRNRELVIIWWIWVMWKAKLNYFSQGKNDFFFSSHELVVLVRFCKGLPSSLCFLFHQVFPRNQHIVRKIWRQGLWGKGQLSIMGYYLGSTGLFSAYMENQSKVFSHTKSAVLSKIHSTIRCSNFELNLTNVFHLWNKCFELDALC